jgi:hypothetical protein
MSKNINLEQELSEKDIAYLKMRGSAGEAQLAWNQKYLRENVYDDDAPDDGEFGDNDGPDMTEEEKADMLGTSTSWINDTARKLPELQAKCKEWELSTNGTKDELRERLLEAVNKEYAPSES